MTTDQSVIEGLRRIACRSTFTLLMTGCFISLFAVLLSGMGVILDPARHIVTQYESPEIYGPGAVISRAEGDAIEQRAMEASRKAAEFSRSSERRQQLARDFLRNYSGSSILLTLLGYLMFTQRALRQLGLIAAPSIAVGLLILVPL